MEPTSDFMFEVCKEPFLRSQLRVGLRSYCWSGHLGFRAKVVTRTGSLYRCDGGYYCGSGGVEYLTTHVASGVGETL
jgi:hypothetical protein